MTPVGMYKGEHRYRAEFPGFCVWFREDSFMEALRYLQRMYTPHYKFLRSLSLEDVQ